MNIKAILLAAAASMSVFSLAACDTNDGPAEELGEQIDDAADEVKDATN